jgi:XTP/dITP diphosphohydrolase
MMDIVLATRNKGKFIELSELLKVEGITYHSPPPNMPPIEETEDTLAGNASLKATTTSLYTHMSAIGDDSGLFIKTLDWFPGVSSARCAGENATDAEKTDFILNKMYGKIDRYAMFICNMSVVWYMKDIGPIDTMDSSVDGYCLGCISEEPYGVAKPGLPYDTIFVPNGYIETFAELSEEEKNRISHRGIAAGKMRKYLVETMNRGPQR